MKAKVSYKISNNNDWVKLKENEVIVDISDNAYFGFRAMEKNAKNIIYDPKILDSIIRLCKESKKFPKTKHLIILDEKTLGYEATVSTESFLKEATRTIEELLRLNPLLKVGFLIKMRNQLEEDVAFEILNKIYKGK